MTVIQTLKKEETKICNRRFSNFLFGPIILAKIHYVIECINLLCLVWADQDITVQTYSECTQSLCMDQTLSHWLVYSIPLGTWHV